MSSDIGNKWVVFWPPNDCESLLRRVIGPRLIRLLCISVLGWSLTTTPDVDGEVAIPRGIAGS